MSHANNSSNLLSSTDRRTTRFKRSLTSAEFAIKLVLDKREALEGANVSLLVGCQIVVEEALSRQPPAYSIRNRIGAGMLANLLYPLEGDSGKDWVKAQLFRLIESKTHRVIPYRHAAELVGLLRLVPRTNFGKSIFNAFIVIPRAFAIRPASVRAVDPNAPGDADYQDILYLVRTLGDPSLEVVARRVDVVLHRMLEHLDGLAKYDYDPDFSISLARLTNVMTGIYYTVMSSKLSQPDDSKAVRCLTAICVDRLRGVVSAL